MKYARPSSTTVSRAPRISTVVAAKRCIFLTFVLGGIQTGERMGAAVTGKCNRRQADTSGSHPTGWPIGGPSQSVGSGKICTGPDSSVRTCPKPCHACPSERFFAGDGCSDPVSPAGRVYGARENGREQDAAQHSRIW